MKKHIFRRALLATSCICAFAAPTYAQDTEEAAGQADAATQADAASDETIVVTGTRVITNGDSFPTPVVVIPTTQLNAVTPSNIPDGLNKLPVFTGSGSQRTTGNFDGNSAGATLNLRGIGAVRNLILLDGHRVPPTSADGTVDTNTLPQMLIQRVDVVTGGASSVYGSDAVTGVVNFVIDRNFNGLKAEAQKGISQKGDVPSYRLGAAFGTDFADDRGHFEASIEHYDSNGLSSNSARKNSSRVYTITGAGTELNPYTLTADSRSYWINFGGRPLFSSLSNQYFATNGQLSPFIEGASTGSFFIQSGGSGGYVEPAGILASLETTQAFARLDYDLTDSLRFYAQGSYSKSRNEYALTPFLYIFKFISRDNAFLPASARNALIATGEPGFLYGKAQTDTEPLAIDSRNRNIYANAGFAGTIFGSADFDISYTHGESRLNYITLNNTNNAKIAAALDAVVGPNGQIVCNVSITNPGLYPGCVPINPFGPTSESQAALDYVRDDTNYILTNKMDDIAANIVFTPFSTWAGEVRAAISGEYRRQSIRTVSSNLPTAIDCTGIALNCVPDGTTAFAANVAGNTSGSQEVSEAAFEFNIPLLKDAPLARSFAVNGAVRYAHYKTSGGAWTWKIGGDWQVTDDLRFRSTRSRDFRAPTLYDLFAPVRLSRTGFTDLHTGFTGVTNLQVQGNPDLKPEVADTFTAGVVYRPGWAPGLSIAVDYFQIKIRDAITTVGGTDVSTQTECEQSNGTSPLCALYVRPLPFSDRSSANYPTLLLTQGLNVASLKSHGIDAEVNYATELGSGKLNLRGLVSWQPELSTQQTANATIIDAAGSPGQPKWKVTGILSYDVGDFGINILHRWRSAVRQNADQRLFYNIPKVPAVGFTDLTVRWDADGDKGHYQFFVSVQNLFDKDPPVWVNAGSDSAPGYGFPAVPGDDIVGRYFTFGVKTRF